MGESIFLLFQDGPATSDVLSYWGPQESPLGPGSFPRYTTVLGSKAGTRRILYLSTSLYAIMSATP